MRHHSLGSCPNAKNGQASESNARPLAVIRPGALVLLVLRVAGWGPCDPAFPIQLWS